MELDEVWSGPLTPLTPLTHPPTLPTYLNYLPYSTLPTGTSMELDEVWYDPRDEALCLLQDVVEKRGREALPRYVCAFVCTCT